jgi:predicted RNA-binding Zn-ribbon protein involved in translation (DUF1610 family)
MSAESHMLSFSCASCHARLQVTINYAGQFAPCPKCGALVLAPTIKTLAVAPLPSSTSSVGETPKLLPSQSTSQGNIKLWREFPSARQKTDTEVVSSRLILADTAISHDEVEKKDQGNFVRMCVLVLLAILFILAIFWLLKSLGKNGFV